MQEEIKKDEYITGSCNIGPEEIYRRQRIGYLGLAGMVIFIIIDINFNLQPVWKLILFAPTVYALSGFLQARQKFCFLFGLIGIMSFSGKRSRIGDPIQLHGDRSKALRLVLQIFIGSSILTLAYYFLT
jgi:hypothetical protein